MSIGIERRIDKWTVAGLGSFVLVLLACGRAAGPPDKSWFRLAPAPPAAKGARVQIGAALFTVPDGCLCDARKLGGADENRKVGGDDESRKLGGADESRKLGGADESRKLGGADENRKLGGDDESRKLGGDDENRKVGGDDESRKLGGGDENRECSAGPDCEHIEVKGVGLLPLVP